MIAKLITITAAAILVLSLTITGVQAATYYIVAKITFDRNSPSCWDDVYFRTSDTYRDPKTGQHPHTIVKWEVENPNHNIYSIVKKVAFNPKLVIDGHLREYMEVHKGGVEIYDHYKHEAVLFDPARTQYTFTWTVPVICR